jgi:hypothetical protein
LIAGTQGSKISSRQTGRPDGPAAASPAAISGRADAADEDEPGVAAGGMSTVISPSRIRFRTMS